MTQQDISHLLNENNSLPRKCVPDAKGWVPHGPCEASWNNGRHRAKITYEHGIAHGPYRDYCEGELSTEGEYRNGHQEGEWHFYGLRDDGTPLTIEFRDGKEVVDWNAFFGRDKKA